MPTTLTSTGLSFPASVTAPSSTDVRNAASVQPGFQACFDAAKFTERALNACAIPADLIAIVAPPNLTKRFIPGQGWYTFLLGDPSATLDPIVYRATDNTGAWFSDKNSYGTGTVVTRELSLRIVGKKTGGDISVGSAWQEDLRVLTPSLAAADYFDLELDLPNLATLTAVDIHTLGLGVTGNPAHKATYDVFRVHQATTLTSVSAGAANDAHTYAGGAGSWLVTIVPTTVTMAASTVIDMSANRYMLRVTSAWDGAGAQMATYRLVAHYSFGAWHP